MEVTLAEQFRTNNNNRSQVRSAFVLAADKIFVPKSLGFTLDKNFSNFLLRTKMPVPIATVQFAGCQSLVTKKTQRYLILSGFGNSVISKQDWKSCSY